MAARSDEVHCLSVSALLDEIEAGFSPSRSPEFAQTERRTDDLKSSAEHANSSNNVGMTKSSDIYSSDDKENCPLAHNSTGANSLAKRCEEPSASFVRKSSLSNGSKASTSLGSSSMSGTNSRASVSALGDTDWRKLRDHHCQEEYRLEITRAKEEIEHLEQAIKDKEAELKSMEAADAMRRNHYIEHVQDSDLEEILVLQEARALSMQPREVACLRDSSFSNDDFYEEMDFQEARRLSMQPRELVCALGDPNCSIDFDEEYDYQEARLLSLQPRDVAVGHFGHLSALNDTSVDFDEEYDIQEARALSMQPWRFVNQG